MGYYIRVLGLTNPQIAISDLRACIPSGQKLDAEEGSETSWKTVVLSHGDGSEIALIEKNPVVPGELGHDELQEFMENIEGDRPESAVKWLREYLPKVKVIYALQLLSGTEEREGWAGVHAVQDRLWRRCGGILQADGEGFSNEDGFHILWQFDGETKGPWQMAVTLPNGEWQGFEMRLEDAAQKAAFLEGRIPRGVKLL